MWRSFIVIMEFAPSPHSPIPQSRASCYATGKIRVSLGLNSYCMHRKPRAICHGGVWDEHSIYRCKSAGRAKNHTSSARRQESTHA